MGHPLLLVFPHARFYGGDDEVGHALRAGRLDEPLNMGFLEEFVLRVDCDVALGEAEVELCVSVSTSFLIVRGLELLDSLRYEVHDEKISCLTYLADHLIQIHDFLLPLDTLA